MYPGDQVIKCSQIMEGVEKKTKKFQLDLKSPSLFGSEIMYSVEELIFNLEMCGRERVSFECL